MGKITVDKDGFSFDVNIAGDQPTEDEVAKIRAFTESEQFSAFKEQKQVENSPTPDPMVDAPSAPSVTEDPMGINMLLPETQAAPVPQEAPEPIVQPEEDTLDRRAMAETAAPVGQEPKAVSPDVMDQSPALGSAAAPEEGPELPEPTQDRQVSTDVPVLAGSPALPDPVDVPQNEPTADLPKPSTSMFTRFNDSKYDWMSIEEKEAAVDEWMRLYRSHPKYDDGGFFGSENYEGTRLPDVMVNPVTKKVEITDSTIVEGVRDGLKFTAVLAADGADLLRNAVGSEVTNENSWGNAVDEYFTDYNETRLWEGLGKEASGLVGPGGAFAKLFGWAAKGMKAAPKVAASVRGAGLSTGLVAGTNPDASGIFLGDEALFKGATDYLKDVDGTGILAGLTEADLTSEDYEKRIQNRFNMILEGGTLGLAAEGAIKFTALAAKTATAMGVNTVMTALGAGQRTAREKRAVQEITAALMAAEGAVGSEAEKQFLQKLGEAMRSNAEIIMEMDKDIIGTLQANPSTMNAYLIAVENGDMQSAANTILRARKINQGANQKYPEVAAKGEAEVNMAGQGVDNAITNLGGEDAVRASAQRVQGQAQAQLDTAADDVSRLQNQLDIAETQLQTAARQNPIIGQALDDIGSRTGIRMTTDRGQLVDNIATRIGEAYKALKIQRNEVYGRVQGGQLDTEGMLAELVKLEPAQLEAARLSLSSTGQLKSLFDVIDQARTVTDTVAGPKGGTKQVTREASPEELQQAFDDALEAAGITDYGTMFQKLRGPLASLKGELFNQNSAASRGAAQSLNDFVEYIDGDLLDSTGDSALVETVAGAKAWDQENFIPYFRNDGPLKDVAQVYDNKVWSSSAEGNVRQGADMPTFMNTATTTFERNMVEENRHYAETILSLLKRPEGGGSTQDVADYVLTKVLSPLSADMKLNGGTPTQGALQSAMDNLSVYATILSKDFPEVADDIRVLQDNLIEGRGDVAMLTKRLDEAKGAYTALEDSLIKDRLKSFFTANGLPVGNATKAFDDLFTDFLGTDGGDRFKSFATQIFESNDPVLIDGMRVAYMKRFKKELFTNTETESGTRVLKLASLTKEADGQSRLFEGLQTVWADNPAVAESYIDLMARAGNEQARATRSAMNVGSNTSLKLEQKAALNSIVTMIMGPLSRRGARIRAAGSRFIDSRVNPAEYEATMERVLADPKLFSDMVDKILKEDYGVGREFLTNTYDTVLASFVQAGIISPNDQSELQDIPFEQWETLRQTEASINRGIEDARNKGQGLIDQMLDVFR